MEGCVLAEFASLNALNPKAVSSSYATPRARPAHDGASTPREEPPLTERLLRGELTYTGSSEHFIEDQPQVPHLGMQHLLPEGSDMKDRERLVRRLEMCAKARDESTRIMSIRFAQRDVVKSDMRRERQQHKEKLMASQKDREERWSRKLQRSPFAVDLVAENQRIDEESRVRMHVEQRRQRLVARRNRDAHNSIFKKATAENDELEQLRAEKRLLLENEKQLRALRDVEKSNARTAQILQERRRYQADRQREQQLGGTPRTAGSENKVDL